MKKPLTFGAIAGAVGLAFMLLTMGAVIYPPATTVINIITTITSNLFSTNIFATNIYSGKVSVNNLYVNDATFTNGIYPYTNTWANAPTGTMDMRILDQYVRTYTPMSITGITSKSNRVTETVTMTVTNAASTNIGVFLADGIILDTRTNCVTASNAAVTVITFRYHPVGLTNAISKQW